MIDFLNVFKNETVHDLIDTVTKENLKDAFLMAFDDDGYWVMDETDYWALLGSIRYFSTNEEFTKWCEENGLEY